MLIVGDVHGKVQQYYNLVKDVEYSLQLGDLGFSDSYQVLNHLDPTRHKVLLGNHDGYDVRHNYEHFLGDFGSFKLDLIGTYYVRGGRSIDYAYRRLGIDWFEEEELTILQGLDCITDYQKAKPQIMFSHECPVSALSMFPVKTWNGEIIKPSFTAKLLQTLFEIHQPDYWFFGHHHTSRYQRINGCQFHCLAELETFKFL